MTFRSNCDSKASQWMCDELEANHVWISKVIDLERRREKSVQKYPLSRDATKANWKSIWCGRSFNHLKFQTQSSCLIKLSSLNLFGTLLGNHLITIHVCDRRPGAHTLFNILYALSLHWHIHSTVVHKSAIVSDGKQFQLSLNKIFTVFVMVAAMAAAATASVPLLCIWERKWNECACRTGASS